jgi:predicted MPP superfamily phosphohydrolase
MPLQIGWNYFPIKEVLIQNRHYGGDLKGIRIIQISDLHLSKKVPIDYIRLLIEKINDIDPDLILFSGDTLQSKAEYVAEHLKLFKNFKAKAYFVSGNHDLFFGLEDLKIIMEQSAVLCLDNKITKLRIKDIELQLVGLSDRYSFLRKIKRPIPQLFSNLDPNIATILLAHQPKDIEHIGSYRIDLQLSGHTHGGQIYPFTKIVKFFQPYFSGLYTHNNTILYVSNGLGYWGLNIRYRAKSEITLLTLN